MGYGIKSLINTSVDDCKISIGHVSDVGMLLELLAECNRIGHKTRARHVSRRIKQLGGNANA